MHFSYAKYYTGKKKNGKFPTTVSNTDSAVILVHWEDYRRIPETDYP